MELRDELLFYDPDDFEADYLRCLLSDATPSGQEGSATGLAEMPPAAPTERTDGASGDTPSGRPADTGHHSGRKRARHKTERSVQLNRAAQLRYREKKKRKVSELEEMVAQLQLQLEGLQHVQAENLSLQAKLVQTQLRAFQAQQEVALLQGSRPAAEKELPQELAARRDQVCNSLESRFITMVEELEQYLAQVDPASAELARSGQAVRTGAELPSSVHAELQRRVAETVEVCLSSMRLCGPDLHRLLTAVERYQSLNSGLFQEPSRWRTVVGVLGITSPQRSQLVAVREKALADLDSVYEERKTLNEQALHLLLSGSEDPDTLDLGKPSMLGRLFGYADQWWDRLTLAGNKGDALTRLHANLEREQAVAMNMEKALLQGVLAPFQAAWAICASFPEHCDALGILNALHEQAES